MKQTIIGAIVENTSTYKWINDKSCTYQHQGIPVDFINRIPNTHYYEVFFGSNKPVICCGTETVQIVPFVGHLETMYTTK